MHASSDGVVVVSLYRALSRVVRLFDRDPALKALGSSGGRVPAVLARRFLRGGVHYRPATAAR